MVAAMNQIDFHEFQRIRDCIDSAFGVANLLMAREKFIAETGKYDEQGTVYMNEDDWPIAYCNEFKFMGFRFIKAERVPEMDIDT